MERRLNDIQLSSLPAKALDEKDIPKAKRANHR